MLDVSHARMLKRENKFDCNIGGIKRCGGALGEKIDAMGCFTKVQSLEGEIFITY